MSGRSHRRVIVGLDGMPHRLIQDLAEAGVMPNTRKVIRGGVLRRMTSSLPEVSSVAWSSIITGTGPGRHGIFGFTDVPDGTYRLSFPNARDLKEPPFWQKPGSGRSVIINVPTTFPASPMNGVLVAGFVALDLTRATYPDSLVPVLNGFGYQIDVDASRGHSSPDLFLKDLNRTLEARIDAYRYLWEKEDWRNFMLVFTGTDRLAHFLWDAYEDETHKYHDAFLAHLGRIDEVVGEILERLDDDDSLVMLSDHGFELLEWDVSVNFFLVEQGFLKFVRDPVRSLADIDSTTRAFALDPGRIYLNMAGKYPGGSVAADEREGMIDQLTASFNSLAVAGRKVIRSVYRKEEIYEGPQLERAPDLVLVPEKGFNLKGTLKANELFEKGAFTGKHTHEDAFLLVRNGAEASVPDTPSVTDVVGIIEGLGETASTRQ